MPYQLIDHTADTGVRVWAETLEQLFAEACRALFEQITNPAALTAPRPQTLRVEGIDLTDLLINWMRACLQIWTVDQCLVQSAHIRSIKGLAAEGQVLAQPFDPRQHPILVDIKAVTYHGARITETDDGWEAAVIFDV